MVRLGTVTVDGTKVRANASKRKATGHGRMLAEEKRLEAEIAALLERAGEVDAEEDAVHGADSGDGSVPEEIARRASRLEAIRAAKARLEARQRAADDAKGRKPGQDRNPRGGRPYKRPYGEPEATAQENFTDPESRIMKTSAEGFQQCFNAQVAVDGGSQMIVATEVGQEAGDQGPAGGDAEPGRGGCRRVARTRCWPTPATAARRSWRHWRSAGSWPMWRWGARGGGLPKSTGSVVRRQSGWPDGWRVPEGRERYARRKWMAEAPHGWIKEAMGFRRFGVRGLEKVRGEWNLVCLALNARRMAAALAGCKERKHSFRPRNAVPKRETGRTGEAEHGKPDRCPEILGCSLFRCHSLELQIMLRRKLLASNCVQAVWPVRAERSVPAIHSETFSKEYQSQCQNKHTRVDYALGRFARTVSPANVDVWAW